MKALLIHQPGSPVRIEDIPDPDPVPGSVVVRLEAAFVAASAYELANGTLPFVLPPTPFVPGMDGIGSVEAVADDVTTLTPGTKVYCDHYYGTPPAAAFIGYFGFTPESKATMTRWRNGSFAEKVLLPAECVTPLGGAAKAGADRLCRLGYLGTAYGGLLKANLKPGQVLAINGGTGCIGVGAVLLGLAMGAARIVPIGRKRSVLDWLHAMDPGRIRPVALHENGSTEDVSRAILSASEGGADVVLDCVSRIKDPASTLAAISALKPGGTAALVGGLQTSLALSYGMMLGRELTVRGAVWFPRPAAAEMLDMIAGGTLDLSFLSPHTYSLDQGAEALAHAGRREGGNGHVVLLPSQ